jgi:ribose-phosphate pyrophosphokinase
MSPEQDRRMMQMFMMAQTAKELGASRVIAVVPYLSYMRQDKRFLDGESVTFELVINILNHVGVDDLVLVDVHNEEAITELKNKYRIKIHALTAIPVLAIHLKESGYDGAYSVSPDKGRRKLVSKASKLMGGGFTYFEKTRDYHTGEITMKIKDVDIAGKKAVVFDDTISSGGTMERAIKGLKDQGADKVAVACTHPLLNPGTEKRLLKAGAELILATDTIETKHSNVSIAGMLADYLKSIL